MAPTAEAPKYVLLDYGKFKRSSKVYEGQSPFAEKINEGPSFKKFPQPLKASGKLDSKYKFRETNPVIGREYKEAQLSEILEDDELLRDLAITISERGVVFFRNQDITTEQQKVLADKLGKLTGKPETSSLHIHPTAPAGGFLDDNGDIDPEVSIINSKLQKELYTRKHYGLKPARDWHSDITFEPVPADYSILRIVETPESGGDTLWASGYELYDKLSKPVQKLVESLTGTYTQPGFKAAAQGRYDIFTGPRGAPENVGDELSAIHPVVRTNPVTGWKSVFAIGGHFTHFNELEPEESSWLTQHLSSVLLRYPELQVRFSWGKNDVAIWDNRSTYHSAIRDVYIVDALRTGVRTVGIGERPYFDPNSRSRTEDLREKGVLPPLTSDFAK